MAALRTGRTKLLAGVVASVIAVGAAVAAPHESQGGHATLTPTRPSIGPVNDGLPRQWFGTVAATAATGGSVKTTSQANVTFTLRTIRRHTYRGVSTNDYQYLPRGKIDISISGTAGVCRYWGSGMTSLRPADGRLDIRVIKRAGHLARATYIGSGEGLTGGPRIDTSYTCGPGPPESSQTGLDWFSTYTNTPAVSAGPRPIRPTAKGLNGVATLGEPVRSTGGKWKWCLKRARAASCTTGHEELAADTGGPYLADRASEVTLDGSGSTGEITRYSWRFIPGEACPKTTILSNSVKVGSTPAVVPLCTLGVTLTVFDAQGRKSSASTEIRVRGRTRGFRMPNVMHAESTAKSPLIDDPPLYHPGIDYGNPKDGRTTLGLNVSACTKEPVTRPILCPAANDVASRLGKQYTLAQVRDPGGPFDGFSYVSGTTLTIERLGILNYWFTPGAPPVAPGKPNWWTWNQFNGVDVAGFLAAISAHEGMGLPGRLETGHSGRLQQWITKENGRFDPRHLIENYFDRDAKSLQNRVDIELGAIDVVLDDESADRPDAAPIWSGSVWLYDPEDDMWRLRHTSI